MRSEIYIIISILITSILTLICVYIYSIHTINNKEKEYNERIDNINTILEKMYVEKVEFNEKYKDKSVTSFF